MYFPQRVKRFVVLCVLLWIAGVIAATQYPEGSAIISINETMYASFDQYFVIANYWPEPPMIITVAILYSVLKPYRVLVLLFNLVILMPVTFGLKTLLDQSRPIQEMGAKLAVILSRDISFFASDSMSFPSGHATSAFALAVFCIYESRCKHWSFTLLFFLLASSAAISRVYLGHHYVIDILMGSVLGTLVSLFITSYAEHRIPIRIKNWRWWN